MISLQRVMKTGRGELLEKDYKTPAFMGRLGQRLAMERILIQVAGFIQSELPIRLAHRIQDLDQVPMMRDMPSVQVVKGIYIHSFLELVQHTPSPIVTTEDEAAFCHLLQSLYKNHSNVLMQMAMGAYELRNAVREGHVPGDTTGDGVVETFAQMEDCHLFLDRFYMSRVGIRVLAGQYLALREQAQEDYLPLHLQNYVGMIKKDTSPYQIVKQTIHDATRMCIHKYGDAPRVNVMGRLDLTFPYLPTHVRFFFSLVGLVLCNGVPSLTVTSFFSPSCSSVTLYVVGIVKKCHARDNGTLATRFDKFAARDSDYCGWNR